MEQQPLTNWKNEPKLENLKRELQASKQAHDIQMSKIRHWTDLIDITGSEKKKTVKGRSSVQPRLIRRQAEWRYAALSEPFLSSSRIFNVKPRTFEDVESARQNDIILNYQFDTKLNKIKFIDEYVKTVVDEGTVIVRVGWERVSHQEPSMEPVFQYFPIVDQQQAKQFQQQAQIKHTNPREFDALSPEQKEAINYFEETQQPVIAQQVGAEQTIKEVIDENKPVLEIINPQNLFVDPSCQGDFNKAMFAIVSFETSKAELQKTGLYTNLDKIQWDMSNIGSDSDHFSTTPSDFTTQFGDPVRNRMIAYEYWGYYDINGTGDLKPIVVTWIQDTIIRMAESPFPDEKLPFVFVPYLPVKRSIYGEPDAELLEDNQHILGAITRGMIDLLGKSANSQQGFAKGMLDPVQKRRFENGQDYEFNPNIPPQQGYIMHSYPETSQTAMTLLQLQNQDAEALTGIKAFSGGLSGNAYGDVAEGIRGMLDAAGKRESAILRRLAKGIVDIGNKILSMNAIFLSDKEIIRISNMEPVKTSQFVEINREDLKGNFDLTVDINTAQEDNTKAQDLGFMLQTIGPSMGIDLNKIILAEIADLKRMPGLAEQIRQYQPQTDPSEEKLKELTLAKLQSEVELNNARAMNAEADAQNTAVDTELTATGVKHAQAMAKQKAQSEGNQELEIVKALGRSIKQAESKPDVEAMVGYTLSKNNLRNAYDNTHRM